MVRIDKFSKVADTKSTHKNLLFLYTNNDLSEGEIKKTIQFTTASKLIKLTASKFSQGGERSIL